jgi:hypothetical protein
MTITYPRDFPDADPAAQRCKFDYTTFGEMSRTAAGAVTFQERMGGSLWELALTTGPLNETNYSRWHAWYLSLRGGQQSFKGRDLRRCYPLAYGKHVLDLTVGGLPFDGSCSVTAVGGSTIALSGLPANYAVSIGDYVSFDWLGGRALVKALEAVTGSGGGTIGSLTVGPWQRTGGAVPAAATVVKAWCLMRPKPGSWSGDRTVHDPVSFEAIQTLV